MDTPTAPSGDEPAGQALPIPANDQALQSADAAATAPAPAVTAQDEDDVIDSAWIAKVKQIVSATAGDPYKQSQQLAALKAEYLQKRYNKSITTT